VKKLLFAALAAVGLALGAAQSASAAWVTRTVYRWDAHCGRYVPCQERYWVPDCDYHHHNHAPPRPAYYPDRPYERGYYPGRGVSLDLGFSLPFPR
jgi:hypothetical protein